MFRQFANPAPLGLSAFALTTFVSSMINLKARSLVEPNIVVGLALFYGGVMMILSGMWEMAVGNTFGATALTSYGGFWLSYGCIFIPAFGIQAAYNPTADGGAALASAVGIYLAGWFIFTSMMLICTLKATVEFFLLFLCVDMTFLMLAIGYFSSVESAFITAGGAFGIGVAFIGWSVSLMVFFWKARLIVVGTSRWLEYLMRIIPSLDFPRSPSRGQLNQFLEHVVQVPKNLMLYVGRDVFIVLLRQTKLSIV